MTKFYAWFSFPNGLGLTSFIHSLFSPPCQLPSLSSSILGSFFLPPPPEFPANFTPYTSLLHPFVLSFLPSSSILSPTPPHTLLLLSLGIEGNLERCRLMTVETCVGHSGLVFENMPGIQNRTSDNLFFLLYAPMSSEQLQPHIIPL